ncbi:hypothetical protein TRIUR3_26900 [Triticum urartu]|uniref:DNA repair metallo-beta-lactamase domain-containing protein n=1 Tax=Triticum urartu TaxID=4572 RepID=M7ZMA2_TRIUA|nr:hypothetical protein TRIUR3_26900 [Triticum urartu]
MRTPPEMPLGLPFTVDTWGPSRRHRCHRFITHAHTDHIAGAWAGPGDTVYATQLTMRLALERYPQLERVKFVEMEVGKRWVVDDPGGAFSVTAYDANHCADVQQLFFGKRCKILQKLLLKLEANLCRLDTVYLDLTFPKFLEFPSKESAIQQVIACISKHSRAPFIYLGCQRLGQEDILKEVSRSFRSKIYVDKGLYLDCFNTLSHTVPEIITDDPTGRFQVLPVRSEELNKIAAEKLEEARASDQPEPLFIRPSAWRYSNAYAQNRKPSLTEAEQDGNVWRVCFSNHSSSNELEQALQLLQPQWVISTTPPNFASELSYVRRRYLSHTTQGHAPSSICFRTTSRGKEDYEYFIRGIPSRGQRSPRVVQIEETWVDHRTFGLSMGVNGYTISKHVINMMGKAIISEQRDAHFLKHVLHSELGKMLQGPSPCRENISNYLSEPNQGFKLENMDAVLVPLLNSKTWYLVVANFWKRRFEALDLYDGEKHIFFNDMMLREDYYNMNNVADFFTEKDDVFVAVVAEKNKRPPPTEQRRRLEGRPERSSGMPLERRSWQRGDCDACKAMACGGRAAEAGPSHTSGAADRYWRLFHGKLEVVGVPQEGGRLGGRSGGARAVISLKDPDPATKPLLR